MSNVIRPLTAREKEGMIEIGGTPKSKRELDVIEKVWIGKNKELIMKEGKKAVISCIRCHRLDYNSGLVYTDSWEDYKRMNFVNKKEITDKHKDRGQWFTSTLGYNYTFSCPVCLANHTLFIEYEREVKNE
jgi:hypothetical protein